MTFPKPRIPPGDEDNGLTITRGPTKQYPCAGNKKTTTLANFRPGQLVDVKWEIGAAHRGSCAIDLSTNGKDTDFKVLKTIDDCADQAGKNFSSKVKLPSRINCNSCTLRFRWKADITKELYLNCADIRINSKINSKRSVFF
ncbi:21342_t:CDS:2 [Cetraspora pellucida]|uniref:21342_t:CDS:1 n=1 Tax=Cetraspora pellucida TaxID=1433469 RepID=A0A9N9F5A6_9GLOM|nr:21342_t:CDS:2 [Cetraspora pellucida]